MKTKYVTHYLEQLLCYLGAVLFFCGYTFSAFWAGMYDGKRNFMFVNLFLKLLICILCLGNSAPRHTLQRNVDLSTPEDIYCDAHTSNILIIPNWTLQKCPGMTMDGSMIHVQNEILFCKENKLIIKCTIIAVFIHIILSKLYTWYMPFSLCVLYLKNKL